ncbi:MAG: hypothetical protein N2512_04145 [Armatimonadetes bacterium]|nr:hypothetical protein [Armatimonadota bacterium]
MISLLRELNLKGGPCVFDRREVDGMAYLGPVVLTLCLAGQPALPQEGASADTWQLARDVVLLAQLAPLRVGQQQVAALFKVLTESRARQVGGPAMAAELSRIKQSLLAGEQLQARDLAQVAALAKSGAERRRALERRTGRGPEPGTDDEELLQKVLAVLEDWQKAVLARPPGILAPAAARARKRGLSEGDLRILLRLREIPPDRWPEAKEDLAKRLASVAEDADRAHLQAAASDFLERIHQMSETDIRARGAELVEEADALVGGSVAALALLAPVDQELLRRRAATLFLDPALPRLLLEMAAARGWALQ